MALYTVGRTFSNKVKNFQFITSKHILIQRKFSSESSDVDDEFELPPSNKFDSVFQSIQHRGYLRAHKPYTPPKNASSLMSEICKKYNLGQSSTLSDKEIKFNVLKECAKEFDHSVPSYLLHKISTMEDVFQFYQTSVSTVFPLEETKHVELPKNLHVLYDYVRFHPETDTMFGGVSAFPESSTIVSDLKAKKKYHGYRAKTKSLGK